MSRRTGITIPLVLAMAAVLCAAVGGCGGGQPPSKDDGKPPEPKGPPLFWDDQENLDWIYRNPHKTIMRTMWLDCAKIVSLGRGDKEPGYALIEAYARDIQQRAQAMAAHWESFAEHGKTLLEAAADKDWPLAAVEVKNFSKGCDSCHLQTWSPIYQHVTKDVVEAWLSNDASVHAKHLDEGEASPATRYRELMQKLQRLYDDAEFSATTKKPEKLAENVKAIMDAAEDGAKRWRWLAQYADTLAKAAAERERENLRGIYRDMASQCHQCHATYAEFVDPKTPPRRIHNPLGWD